MTRGKLIFFERSDTDKFLQLIVIMLQFTSIRLHRTCILVAPPFELSQNYPRIKKAIYTDLHFRNDAF